MKGWDTSHIKGNNHTHITTLIGQGTVTMGQITTTIEAMATTDQVTMVTTINTVHKIHETLKTHKGSKVTIKEAMTTGQMVETMSITTGQMVGTMSTTTGLGRTIPE